MKLRGLLLATWILKLGREDEEEEGSTAATRKTEITTGKDFYEAMLNTWRERVQALEMEREMLLRHQAAPLRSSPPVTAREETSKWKPWKM